MTTWNKAYHANCWGGLGGDAVGVTSITRLTYRTFGDMEQAIRDIGALGYSGCELFDGNLLDYEGRLGDLRALLDANGVRLLATYAGANFIFEEILEEELIRIERGAAAAAEAGASYLVVGGGAKRAGGTEPDDYKRLGAGLDRVVAIARKHGLTAHYHPHLTTITENAEEVRAALAETSIDLCPDTAHLAAAGADVPALIREHGDRISYVHLKGFQADPFAFTPLDEGSLDMDAVIDALRDIAYSGWVLVELDSWPDPRKAAARSMAYLRSAEAAQA
ncbi:MAG: sugar phosphate isomerase/epimerase [Rhodospirillales bacterium]|nr:sugar phosphate isomerase/epimerase [Rhodospirillales bacterium]